MNLPDRMKLATLSYWCFERQHMMGAFECNGADVLTVSKAFVVYETEVKISIADMQREISTKNYKHRQMREQRNFAPPNVHHFYFIVPSLLGDKALEVIDQRYPYAGLLLYEFNRESLYHYGHIQVARKAKKFKRNKVSIGELMRIGYSSRNTIIGLGEKLINNPTVQ